LTRVKAHHKASKELYLIQYDGREYSTSNYNSNSLVNENTIVEGKNVKVGDMLVNRLVPTENLNRVGPFLLLDHSYPVGFRKGAPLSPHLNEHPHRGLVTFTYVIDGEVEHFDSLGNREIVAEGGAHWLSAGRGVIHGERVSDRLVQTGGILHAIQFWTNIPAVHKSDLPQYKALKAEVFPVASLSNHGGLIRILLGKCGSYESPVGSLSGAFLYRVTLNAKSEFGISVGDEMKRAIFVPDDLVMVNGSLVGKSQLLILENNCGEIALRNPGISKADAYILGGPEPAERVIVQGPFAMNSQKDISDAYRDFFAGEYGKIPKSKEV
jgi:redox-sensitive bicupin YhaK (pirin superfamily)